MLLFLTIKKVAHGHSALYQHVLGDEPAVIILDRARRRLWTLKE